MNKSISRIFSTILFYHLVALSVFGQNSESGRLFEGKGATLYYEIRGSKSTTPLFVINGGPGVDHTYMHSTLSQTSALDEIGKNRPVIFYDPRGVGKSPALKTGQSCTIADQVADLDALRASLGYKQIDVLGHSFGGYLAIAYASRYPERISHLVLSDSGAPKWPETVFLFERVFPDTSERMEAIKVTDKETLKAQFMLYLSMLFYSPEHRDAYLAKVKEINVNTEINERLNKDAENLDFTPELAKFRFPTLVITGRFDMNIAPSVAYKIHKAIPNSRFAVFEHSGHLPFYEEQQRFVQLTDEFLSGK